VNQHNTTKDTQKICVFKLKNKKYIKKIELFIKIVGKITLKKTDRMPFD